MMNNDIVVLEKVLETVQNCTKNPENFLSVQEDVFEEFKHATKCLYDLAFKKKVSKRSQAVLSELIVQNFDTEQIWQQIELENNEQFSSENLAEISRILSSKEPLELPVEFQYFFDQEAKKTRNLNKENGEQYQEDEEEEEEEKEESMSEKFDDDDDDDDDDGGGGDDYDDDDIVEEKDQGKKTKTSNNPRKRKKTSKVDDKFFKLHQLDDFLNKEDKREIAKQDNTKNDSSDEESIDLFNDFSDDIDDEEEPEDEEMDNGKSLKYADFFDSPESNDEDHVNESAYNADYSNYEEDNDNYNDNKDYDDDNMNNQNDNNDDRSDEKDNGDEVQQEKSENNKKKVKFDLLNDENESDSKEKSADKNEEKNEGETVKSTLELRQERLKKRIETLEQEAIAKKPWPLMGEVSATDRPENSLLEEYVDFDVATRPAPVMTEQTTMKLEDIILKRIKDKAWDDVEKKFKPVETPMEYKRKLIMNQEKSKESLAQIYENEYIKQREALNADDKDEPEKEEPPEHIEIKQRLHDLFTKLDALSNFHYTPKMAKPEIKIISNVPAISMEEVAPVAATDATLLAPEEIKSKHKGELIGESERTKTDKKRARRKKKLKQHARAVNESKKSEDNVIKHKKSKNKSVLGKLKARNIIDKTEDSNKMTDKSIKSSTAFFNQLQDQVQSAIKQKTSKTIKKKDKNTLSAIKLKL